MEARLSKLEVVYRRAERPQPVVDHTIDWRAVPAALPACFAALTAAECAEWGELMTDSHAPGAVFRHQDDRAFYRRLAALDNRIDWRAGEHPLIGVAEDAL